VPEPLHDDCGRSLDHLTLGGARCGPTPGIVYNVVSEPFHDENDREELGHLTLQTCARYGATPDAVYNAVSRSLQVIEDREGGLGQLMPRMCARVCSASETAYEAVSEPLQDVILLLQQGDAFAEQKKKDLARGREVGAHDSGTWSTDDRGLLYRNDRLYVPRDQAMQQELLRIHHDDLLAGHFGIERTSELLRRKFYWKGMKQDVEDYVSTCAECQRNKPHRHRPYGNLNSLPIPERPWQEITMDFITGLPPCEYQGRVYDAILVVMDRYTKRAKYIHTMKTLDAAGLADLLEEYILRDKGTPEGIVTDRGGIFTSNYWSELCYNLRIQRKFSTAFHPQTDGQTERQNQTVEAYLRAYCNDWKNDWVRKLGTAEFSYNNSKHSTTGMSPFMAESGYNPTIPAQVGVSKKAVDVPSAKERIVDLIKARVILQRNWSAASANQVKHYDKLHIDKSFKLNEWVLLSSKNIRFRAGKLAPKYIGPFKIIKVVGSHAYELKLPPLYERIHPVFHVSLLESYRSRDGEEPGTWNTPELEDESEPEEWEVETIVDRRGKGKKVQYLVRWKGWPKEYDEWVHEGFLDNAKESVDEFEARGVPTPAPNPPRRSKKRKRNT